MVGQGQRTLVLIVECVIQDKVIGVIIMQLMTGSRLMAIVFASTTIGFSGQALAGSQKIEEAYQNCARAIAKEIGVRQYTVFERKHALGVNTMRGTYRFYLNATYKHPDLEAVQEYRALCESGGFAKLGSVEVQAGQWDYPEKGRGFLNIEEEENWVALQR